MKKDNQIDKIFNTLPQPVLLHIQKLERTRQDFVANVSHELRTPLTVIHGYLEILLEQIKDSKYLDSEDSDSNTNLNTQKIYNLMFQQTTRMQNIIADLLLLSSLESDE